MSAPVKKFLAADSLIAEINKKFGNNTLVRACDAIGLVKPRISTGSFALDIVLGGGYPEGAIELIEGEPTSGKSWNLLTRARHFLDKHEGGVFILVNAEGSNDIPFLQMHKVDVNRTFILSPDSGEQAWDAAHEVATRSEKVYIGIDSLDAMVPLSELGADMDQAHYAPAAKMNNKGFRKLISVMKNDITTMDHRVTVGVICQVRANIGVMFGDPNTSVGGKGKMFAASQIIRYKRIKYLRTEGEKVADRITYGMEIEAEVKKSKGCGEGEVVRFNIYKENFEGFRRGDADNVTELIPFLLRYKIIQKTGAWYVIDNGEKFNGVEAVAKSLRENEKMRDELIERVKVEVNKRHTVTAQPEAPKSKAAHKLASIRKRSIR
jgi:recombination protein RecA